MNDFYYGKTPLITQGALDEIDAALDRIDQNPEEWIQSAWACGTGGCLLGHIIMNRNPQASWAEVEQETIWTGLDLFESTARSLGLNIGDPIWSATNSREHLQDARNDLADRLAQEREMAQ